MKETIVPADVDEVNSPENPEVNPIPSSTSEENISPADVPSPSRDTAPANDTSGDPGFPENSAALQALRDEMEGYLREKDALIHSLQQREQQLMEAGHRQIFRTVLTDMGAHPAAAELMASLMEVAPFQGERAAMESAARGLRDKYPPLFLREETRGIPPVAPLPGGSVPLTRSQVADLSEGEIIARWPQVCSALQQR